MSDVRIGDVVTPDEEWLTLHSSVDAGLAERVRRGEALWVLARRPDGQVEVEYLRHRWLAPEHLLQPWQPTPQPAGTVSRPTVPPAANGRSWAHGPLPGTEAPRIGRRAITLAAMAVGVLLLGIAAMAAGVLLGELAPTHRSNSQAQPSVRDRVISVPVTSASPAPSPGATALSDATATPPVSAPAAQPSLPPSPSPAARSPTPTAAPPVVANLVVCDRTVDCGVDVASLSRASVVACLRVTPGGDGRPLVLVATNREEAPTSVDGPTVVARSGAVEQNPALSCHTVRAVSGLLPAGTYWMWVVYGATALTGAKFVVGP